MKRTWTSEELLEHFTLLPDELTAVGNKSGATRLGFAILFKCFQYEGRFLRSRQEAAPEVVRFLATQVGVDAALVPDPAAEGEEEEELPLTLLRLDPGPVGVESALSEIAKLRSLRAIGLPSDLFQGYPPKLVERLRRRIGAESPSHIRQHPQAIRMTLLAALVFQRTQEVTDALVTLLIQIVHRIGKRAERRVETAYINDLKRVAGKTRILYRIADAALEHPDKTVREVVFPVAN